MNQMSPKKIAHESTDSKKVWILINSFLKTYFGHDSTDSSTNWIWINWPRENWIWINWPQNNWVQIKWLPEDIYVKIPLRRWVHFNQRKTWSEGGGRKLQSKKNKKWRNKQKQTNANTKRYSGSSILKQRFLKDGQNEGWPSTISLVSSVTRPYHQFPCRYSSSFG